MMESQTGRAAWLYRFPLSAALLTALRLDGDILKPVLYIRIAVLTVVLPNCRTRISPHDIIEHNASLNQNRR